MLRAIAIFFICLGITWFIVIQVRCNEISPRSISSGLAKNLGISEKPLKMVRSPHAKDYHLILFWVIAGMEIFVALFYIVAGIFMLKRYYLGQFVVVGVLCLDVALKTLVIFYMQFCAIPLAHLTKNANVLQLYFMPSMKGHAVFSSIATGYRIFEPGGILFLVLYLLYFGLCFNYFDRQDIKLFWKPRSA